MADTQRFLNAYNIVIDENGNFKTCGRQACINLINIANEIEPDVSHGNSQSGMMNIRLIQDLKEKLEKAS